MSSTCNGTSKAQKPVQVLVMCLGDASSDPRPKRAIELCMSEGYEVDVVSYPFCGNLIHRYHWLIPAQSRFFVYRLITKSTKLFMPVIPGDYLKNYINDIIHRVNRLDKMLIGKKYDLLIIEDLQLLPVALKVRCGAKVIFDAREYYPRQRENSLFFRIFEKPERVRLCKTYLKQCDAVVTVSEELAKEYNREFYVKANLIRSVPFYSNCKFREVVHNRIRLVHHGAANRNRQLEKMIKIVEFLDDRFTLDFYLTGDNIYINELKKRSSAISRIRFIDPVPFDQIIETLNQYDIGLFYVEPTTFNLKHCLPNKIFEFIQARLMVAIGPSPDMANLVQKYQCGIITESFDPLELSRKLLGLNPDKIMTAKQNSELAARELCFEEEGKKLLQIISALVQ